MVRHAHHPEPVEGQNTNNKQIPMTEIQNPKHIGDPEKQNISLVIGIKDDTISEYRSQSFWSLKIGI